MIPIHAPFSAINTRNAQNAKNIKDPVTNEIKSLAIVTHTHDQYLTSTLVYSDTIITWQGRPVTAFASREHVHNDLLSYSIINSEQIAVFDAAYQLNNQPASTFALAEHEHSAYEKKELNTYTTAKMLHDSIAGKYYTSSSFARKNHNHDAIYQMLDSSVNRAYHLVEYATFDTQDMLFYPETINATEVPYALVNHTHTDRYYLSAEVLSVFIPGTEQVTGSNLEPAKLYNNYKVAYFNYIPGTGSVTTKEVNVSPVVVTLLPDIYSYFYGTEDSDSGLESTYSSMLDSIFIFKRIHPDYGRQWNGPSGTDLVPEADAVRQFYLKHPVNNSSTTWESIKTLTDETPGYDTYVAQTYLNYQGNHGIYTLPWKRQPFTIATSIASAHSTGYEDYKNIALYIPTYLDTPVTFVPEDITAMYKDTIAPIWNIMPDEKPSATYLNGITNGKKPKYGIVPTDRGKGFQKFAILGYNTNSDGTTYTPVYISNSNVHDLLNTLVVHTIFGQTFDANTKSLTINSASGEEYTCYNLTEIASATQSVLSADAPEYVKAPTLKQWATKFPLMEFSNPDIVATGRAVRWINHNNLPSAKEFDTAWWLVPREDWLWDHHYYYNAYIDTSTATYRSTFTAKPDTTTPAASIVAADSSLSDFKDKNLLTESAVAMYGINYLAKESMYYVDPDFDPEQKWYQFVFPSHAEFELYSSGTEVSHYSYFKYVHDNFPQGLSNVLNGNGEYYIPNIYFQQIYEKRANIPNRLYARVIGYSHIVGWIQDVSAFTLSHKLPDSNDEVEENLRLLNGYAANNVKVNVYAYSNMSTEQELLFGNMYKDPAYFAYWELFRQTSEYNTNIVNTNISNSASSETPSTDLLYYIWTATGWSTDNDHYGAELFGKIAIHNMYVNKAVESAEVEKAITGGYNISSYFFNYTSLFSSDISTDTVFSTMPQHMAFHALTLPPVAPLNKYFDDHTNPLNTAFDSLWSQVYNVTTPQQYTGAIDNTDSFIGYDVHMPTYAVQWTGGIQSYLRVQVPDDVAIKLSHQFKKAPIGVVATADELAETTSITITSQVMENLAPSVKRFVAESLEDSVAYVFIGSSTSQESLGMWFFLKLLDALAESTPTIIEYFNRILWLWNSLVDWINQLYYMLEESSFTLWNQLRDIHWDLYSIKFQIFGIGPTSPSGRMQLGRWLPLSLVTRSRISLMNYLVPPVRTVSLGSGSGSYLYFALASLHKETPTDSPEHIKINYFDNLLAQFLLPNDVPDSILHTKYTNLYINQLNIDLSGIIDPSVSQIVAAYMVPYWETQDAASEPEYPIGNLVTYMTTANVFDTIDNPGDGSPVKIINSAYNTYKRPFGLYLTSRSSLVVRNQGLPVQVVVLYTDIVSGGSA